MISFPAGFSWGAATAAFQVEGAWNAEGKGPSVWDALGHRRGGFVGGANGDVTCDHYHRFEEDLELIAGLGVDAYRFSVSWPRVQPDGIGAWNQAGLDFYDRLIDGLLGRGVEPTLTLYHWDHPLSIEERGGWLSRDIVDFFADYAGGLAVRYGDRVARWITLNEPLSVMTGYALGFSRPAGPVGLKGGLLAAHHQLLAHGAAVERLRAADVVGDVGIALSVAGFRPVDATAESAVALHRAEVLEDRLFLDPLLLGTYPELEGRPVIECPEGDLVRIAARLDFVGINWYCPGVIAPSGAPRPDPRPGTLDELLVAAPSVFGYARASGPGSDHNVMGWPAVPSALGDVLRWLRREYPSLPPLYVTENGLPEADTVIDGGVRDPDRIAYLTACVEQVATAIEDGMDIRGYYVWSLLDNLEWGLGFGPRFGLVHVDFETLQRTPKASYGWYRDRIAVGRVGRTDHAKAGVLR